MTQQEQLDKLKENVDRLHDLLSNPHPGLSTWMQFVAQRWKAIADLWEECK